MSTSRYNPADAALLEMTLLKIANKKEICPIGAICLQHGVLTPCKNKISKIISSFGTIFCKNRAKTGSKAIRDVSRYRHIQPAISNYVMSTSRYNPADAVLLEMTLLKIANNGSLILSSIQRIKRFGMRLRIKMYRKVPLSYRVFQRSL